MDFSPYLVLCGVEDVEAASAHITTWEALWVWLDEHQSIQYRPAPAPQRTPIGTPKVDTSWKKALKSRFVDLRTEGRPVGQEPLWPAIVERRRRVSLTLSLILTSALCSVAYETLAAQHLNNGILATYLLLYGIMSYFMVATFIKLAIGSWHAMRGAKANPWHPAQTERAPDPNSRVAVLFPVYHEDPARVVAGMIATARSLVRHAPEHTGHYDFFLLSDSRQEGYRIAELASLNEAKLACPQIRFHYRWRSSNDNAKLGNVTDFCRRWGSLYAYMLVMDADSLMNGETIHRLLRMMEGNHRLGILQTNPTPILRKSLFGRMQQFAGRLYGSAFSYSLQAMYMGHASYIGHNALIRTQAFIEHCLLPDLPGKKPWGGKPLSHDIIEAALMARGGYEVWFLPDLGGSYEEIPANILSFLIRERRWMQGNLQHARFFFLEGLKPLHRENFITGFMGYISAPLWASFLVISAASMISYMKSGHISLGNIAQVEVPSAMMLLASIVFLFTPRFMAIALNFTGEKAARYGGKGKILLSTAAETLFSFFFAPLMMAFITKFIWFWVKRKSISWGTQQRDDEVMPWSECFKYFGWTTCVGVVASYLLYLEVISIPEQARELLALLTNKRLEPNDIFLWFTPILGGLCFSILIARLTSRTFEGLRRAGWFVIPEEFSQPQEITDLLEWNGRLKNKLPDPDDVEACVRYALSCPQFYLQQRASSRRKPMLSARILDKLNTNENLSLQEFMLAISEKSCLDALQCNVQTARQRNT